MEVNIARFVIILFAQCVKLIKTVIKFVKLLVNRAVLPAIVWEFV